MVFWKGWSWEVQTGAMRHTQRLSDQEASLSSLAPVSLRDSLQSYLRVIVVLLPDCDNYFRKG